MHVSNEKIKENATDVRDRIAAQAAAQANQPAKPLVERMSGLYLGSSTVPLAYAASLPSVFRDQDITLNFPARTRASGKVNLSTVAARITEVTNIPVRIQPDVFISAKSLVKNGSNAQVAETLPRAQPNNLAAPMPMPTPLPVPNGGNAAVSMEMSADYDTNVPMEYSGTLAGYLDFICARLGINWEYKNGGIVLFRLMTKSFEVKVNPGDIKYSSSLSKGGGATTGSAGGNGSATATSGSFTSDTASSVEAKASLWKSIASAVNGMKSPLGTPTVDEAAGLVTITDTKDVVREVENYINTINATMTRSVDLEVRVLQVTTQDSSSQGFDLNLLYSKINAAGVVESAVSIGAPASLTSVDAGKVGFSVISPSKRWSGSEIVAQVLNSLGTVVRDDTRTATTTNRVPVPLATFDTETYLATTTPAAGGGTGGGQGVPGLTPGQITTGNFLNALPTAYADGSVILRLAFDDTASRGMGTFSTGSGQTFQQIQLPKYSGSKSDHNVPMRDGESLVLVGKSTLTSVGNQRLSITGYSMANSITRTTEIIVVTPRVRNGI